MPLSPFLCKMGVIIPSTSRTVSRIKWMNQYKVLSHVLGPQWMVNRYDFIFHSNHCPLYLRQSAFGESLDIIKSDP